MTAFACVCGVYVMCAIYMFVQTNVPHACAPCLCMQKPEEKIGCPSLVYTCISPDKISPSTQPRTVCQ